MTSHWLTLAVATANAAPTAAEASPVASQAWHAALVDWTITFSLALTCIGMIFCIYRLLRGPHIADRALAVDTLGIHLIALVVLLSLQFRTLVFFDGILVLSLVGFAGTVAMAQYIGRPYIKKKIMGMNDRPPSDALADQNDPAAGLT